MNLGNALESLWERLKTPSLPWAVANNTLHILTYYSTKYCQRTRRVCDVNFPVRMFGVTRSDTGSGQAGGSPLARPIKAEAKTWCPAGLVLATRTVTRARQPVSAKPGNGQTPAFVGIDVVKHRLEVHLRPSGESFTIDTARRG